MMLQVIATIILASLSLKYIENPIRYNGFRDSLSRLWGRGWTSLVPRHVWWKRTGLLMTLLLLCYSVSQMVLPVAANSDSHTVSMSTVLNGEKSAEEKGQNVLPAGTKPAGSDKTNQDAQAGSQSGVKGKPEKNNKPEDGDAAGFKPAKTNDSASVNEDQNNEASGNEPDKSSDGAGNGKADQSGPEAVDGNKDTADSGKKAEPSTPVVQDGKINYTIIGDSVILDAKPYLEQSIGGVYVDGHIGRQMWQAGDVLQDLKQNKQLGSQVVLELGTNGSFNSRSLKAVLDGLKDESHVYLVTVRVPRPWERTVNKALEEAASNYSNVSLIDWYGASEGHDEYFEKDGVHLTVTGSEAFAALVKSGIQ